MKIRGLSARRAGFFFYAVLWLFFAPNLLPAESIFNLQTQISVQVDASSGAYRVDAQKFKWKFEGSIGRPMLTLQKQSGRDGIGPFQSLIFQWKENVPLEGKIQLYANKPIVLFQLIYLKKAEKQAKPFPTFLRFPDHLKTLSFQDRHFSPPKFVLEDGATPWLFFDKSRRAFLISPADYFMIAQMTGQKEGAIRRGLNTGVRNIPRGFTESTLLVLGKGINRTWDAWGHALTDWHGKKRPANDADIGLNYLGYWTDNGGTYYYNFDTTKGYRQTLLDLMNYYRKREIPFHYLQLDSWWYPKTFTSASGKKPKNPHPRNPKMPKGIWNRYGGMLLYEADTTLFPGGLGAFHKELGLPLITHNRWIDWESPYRKKYKIFGVGAVDPNWWDNVISKIASWGVVTYEQDWLDHIYQYSPEMQTTTWAGEAFMDNMARACAEHGLTIQYCMAMPRHFLQAAKYDNVTTIRVSGDRFKKKRWKNEMFGSRLASALGIYPWVDVFRSWETGNMLLATLSAGMVGPGDPMGKEDAENIFRAVRRDGVIVKPDVPLVPTDGTYWNLARKSNAPLAGWTLSDFGKMKIYYVFAWNPDGKAHKIVFQPKFFGLNQNAVLYNYFTGKVRILKKGKKIKWKLAAQALNDPFGAKKTGDWAYFVLAPLVRSGVALLGDVHQFVPAGKKRINRIDPTSNGLKTEVLFARGESEVELLGFARHRPKIFAQKGQANLISFDKKTGLFHAKVSPDAAVPWQKTPHGNLIKTVAVEIQ